MDNVGCAIDNLSGTTSGNGRQFSVGGAVSNHGIDFITKVNGGG